MTSLRDAHARRIASHGPTVGSVCTGYGGLDLGVLTALGGGQLVWVADPDPHVGVILATRMPGVPNLGDITSLDWTRVEPVDVLTAGFPCQDISAAGRRLGIEKGKRSGLWTDIVGCLRVLRPALLVVENVAALRWKGGGLHRVLGDLAEAGYDALWRSVRAADVGAPHGRERVFLLAWRRPQRNSPRDTQHDRDAAADPARRIIEWHQRGRQAGRSVPSGPVPVVPDANRCRLSVVSDSDGAQLGPVDPAKLGDTYRFRSAAAHTACDGRDEGLPGTARFQRRPDAALSSHPPAHPERRQHQERRQFIAIPDSTTGNSSHPGPSASVNWGVYEAAIQRWEAVLGRPVPPPTQLGNRGRPVLSPAFVEHLMGLDPGWVTDLPLPRTAQLHALGNGVVPQQAANAVSLLLADLAAVFDTRHQPEAGLEVSAA